MALLFVKIGSSCLFWISTLPGPTLHPAHWVPPPHDLPRYPRFVESPLHFESVILAFFVLGLDVSSTIQGLVQWFYPIALSVSFTLSERCQPEIDRVLEKRDHASYDDRHNMPYMQVNFINLFDTVWSSFWLYWI